MVGNDFCVLIVDDEKRMVMGLRDYFKANGYIVYEAYDGREALDVFYEHNTEIDLVLLDVMMPVMDGLQVLEEVRKNEEEVPVIMLTAKGEEYDQLQGFRAGADDYVAKPFSPVVLLARMEAVLKRLNKHKDKELNCGEICIELQKNTVCVGGEEVELTRREFDLLHYMVLNNGIALSREKLLTQVWGYDFDGDPRTVDTHVKQLRMKLKGCGSYIKTVRMIGYIFEVVE